MIAQYTPFIRWYKNVTDDAFSSYSKKNQKRLRSTIAKLEENNIVHKIQPLDQTFLDWFEPFYKKQIEQKNNAKVHDLYAATFGRDEHKYEYYGMTLFENNKPIGGVILFVGIAPVMIAYKASEHSWSSSTLQVSPSLYMDFIITSWAKDQNKEYISHGKDRNPYGLNSSIGLATYKLSAGYTPRLMKLQDGEEHEVHKIDLDTLEQDTLIMRMPTKSQDITTAILVRAKDNDSKYAQLLSYSKTLTITLEDR